MPKSPAERAGIPLSTTAASAVPHHEDQAWKAWMGHVDAGRIGSFVGLPLRYLRPVGPP